MSGVTVTIEQARILVRFQGGTGEGGPYEAHKDRVKALVGAQWVKARLAWSLPASPFTADALAVALRGVGSIGEVSIDPALSELRAQTKVIAAAGVDRYRDDVEPIPTLPDAWAHQRQAFWFAEPLEAVMLAMGMGTGKSAVAVALHDYWQPALTLVGCPKNVRGVWPREFRKWGTQPVTVCAPVKGPKGGELTVPKRVAAIERALAEHERTGVPLVVVVNHDSAWTERVADLLTSVDWQLEIIDESHRIKAPTGKAAKFYASMVKRTERRMALTGTLFPHSQLDAFSQYRALDPGIFGDWYTPFKAKYAVERVLPGTDTKIVAGYINEGELAARIAPITLVVDESVLDLPPTLHVPKTTVLGTKARVIYDDLYAELVAFVEAELERGGGVISVKNTLTKILRLQQVTSGLIPLDDPDFDGEREWVEIDTSKAELFADTTADFAKAEPLVVCTRFRHDLDKVRAVADKQGRRYGELSGRRHDGLTDDATMRPDIDLLGVQIQSGGVGVDLTRAHRVIDYSCGYSLGDWDQWLKRTDRPGQEHPVTYYNLACEDTIDGDVYDSLNARRSLVDFVKALVRQAS